MRVSIPSWVGGAGVRGPSIGRWPRRVAALSCLLLAALAATRHDSATATARPTLAPGQRAVPVTVQGNPSSYLHTGAVVELLAAPLPAAGASPETGADPPRAGTTDATPVAAAATVLSMHQLDDLAVSSTGGWQLVVAVDEATARRLAGLSGQALLAVTGTYP